MQFTKNAITIRSARRHGPATWTRDQERGFAAEATAAGGLQWCLETLLNASHRVRKGTGDPEAQVVLSLG